MLMDKAILLSKRGSLANIIGWAAYKARLIKEFGSIDIFGVISRGFSNTSLVMNLCRKFLKI